MIDRLAERAVRNTFERCDVRIGGSRPWDIRVHGKAWYRRMALNPALQLGAPGWEQSSVEGRSSGGGVPLKEALEGVAIGATGVSGGERRKDEFGESGKAWDGQIAHRCSLNGSCSW